MIAIINNDVNWLKLLYISGHFKIKSSKLNTLSSCNMKIKSGKVWMLWLNFSNRRISLVCSSDINLMIKLL